jgi:UTP-glucose-1-phosphate uridylyltransferase
VGDNPFAVILADDLLYGKPPVMQQMIEVFHRYHSSGIGVEEIPQQDTKSYDIVDGKRWEDSIIKMSGIVDKPAPEVAPSNLGVVGRYVLKPRIFFRICVRSGLARAVSSSSLTRSSRYSPMSGSSLTNTTARASTAVARSAT